MEELQNNKGWFSEEVEKIRNSMSSTDSKIELYHEKLEILLKTKEITEKQLEDFVTNHTDAQSDLCDTLNEKTDSQFWIDNHLALDDIADDLNINRPDLPSHIKIITPDKVKERSILYLRETINFELLKLFLVECISDGSLINLLY